ncbi:MAG: PadR family transcriptional regulator [Ilumatobacteraceae bacterium]
MRRTGGVIQLARHSDKRSQWLKGILDLCVLGILVDGEAYGYEIAGRLHRDGIGQIKGGTLYPALAKLEDDGYVAATWRTGDGGPNRKYYSITQTGATYLAVESAGWQTLADAAGVLMGLRLRVERH